MVPTPSTRFSWSRRAETLPVVRPEPVDPPRRAQTDLMYQPINANGKELIPQSINAYNLKWEKLRAWLIKKHKDLDSNHFVQKQVRIGLDQILGATVF